MEKKIMLHTGLSKGDIGRYVFLPGSPERTEKIAKYFDEPKEIAFHREFRTWTGKLSGVPVAVTSTGIGGPSTGIAMEELYECGANTMMRVGSCASVSPKVRKGDICVINGAVRMEGLGLHYLPIEFPAVPDYQMLKHEVEAAEASGLPYNVGVTITKESFYTQTSPETKPIGYELINRWKSYVAGGATNTSMECASMFLVGASLGIRTGSIMVSATDCEAYEGQGNSKPLNDLEDRVIRVAIDAMKRIIAEDLAQGR